MAEPSRIIIEESAEREVRAVGVDAMVRISGQSLFTGNQVLEKSKEVQEFVADLGKIGIPEGDVTLRGVEADVSSGLLGKSSRVTYLLTVRCKAMDLLAPVLRAVASQKNAQVHSMQWRYDGLDEIRNELAVECSKKAKERGERTAKSLGLHITSLGKLDLKFQSAEDPHYRPHDMYCVGESKWPNEEIGDEVTLSHTKIIRGVVVAEFLASAKET